MHASAPVGSTLTAYPRDPACGCACPIHTNTDTGTDTDTDTNIPSTRNHPGPDTTFTSSTRWATREHRVHACHRAGGRDRGRITGRHCLKYNLSPFQTAGSGRAGV